MDTLSAGLVFSLLEKMATLLLMASLVAYLASRTRYFSGILSNRLSAKNQLLLIVLFGLLGIYGTYSGIKTSGVIVNVREIAPMAAGLIGGPIVGVGAGLISGVHRYNLGGFTAIPCGLSTVLSGLVAGMIYRHLKGRLISIRGAVLFGFLMESFNMALILLIARPFSRALDTVQVISLPMILADTVGLALFVLLTRYLLIEKKEERQWDATLPASS